MTSLAFRLHKLFNEQNRFTFPFKDREKEIPRNGIYVIFEKGETFNDIDRIVRVGTHTGEKQLRSRLNQHFVTENKNRSISVSYTHLDVYKRQKSIWWIRAPEQSV